MSYINVEIKARCPDASFIREYLVQHKAEFKGTDDQTDTYFNVPYGRLKLREGVIENNLIYYQREDKEGPKDSEFTLMKVNDPLLLKQILTQAAGIKTIVRKKREIYYIGNVKFHLDEVPGLGNFVEIEAGNMLAGLSAEQLKTQCEHYLNEFGIRKEDLLSGSYSDMPEKDPLNE